MRVMDRASGSWVALSTVLLLALAGPGCDALEARGLAKEGNALYKSGRYTEALARFKAAAALEPDFPTLRLHLGYTHLALASAGESGSGEDHAARAAAAFSRFMALRPEDERGPRYYLQVLLDAGKTGEALAFLGRQHRDNPRDLKILSSLGMVASRAGRFDEALGWYDKRRKLLPGDPAAHYLVGTLIWRQLYKNEALAGQARIRLADRGLAALDRALDLRPGYAEALTYKNLLYRERARGQVDPSARDRDMASAREFYKKALKATKKVRKTAPGAEEEKP